MIPYTEDDALNLIASRIETKQYWTFITDSHLILKTIEDMYYEPGTPANHDFILTLRFHPTLIAIAFGKKSRMNFDQLYALIGTWMDKKQREEIKRRHETQQTDIFCMPTIEQNQRHIAEVMFELQGTILERLSKKIGLEKVLGSQCGYHNTMLAEQLQENHIPCQARPTKAVSGYDTDARPKTMPLCDKHFRDVNRWAGKQAPIF